MFDAFKGLYHRVWIWLSLAITLPYGIRILLPALGWEVIVPTEPLIAILIFSVMAGAAVQHRAYVSTRWTLMDLAVLLYVGSHIPAAVAATHSLAAVKATLVQFAHITLFYAVPRLGSLPTSVTPAKLLRWWAFALTPLIVFAWTNHILVGLDRAGSHHTAFPFFMDHNGYAAALCIAVPVFGGMAMEHFRKDGKTQKAALFAILTMATLITILFTFSRGAWLGLVAACMITSFAYRRDRLARRALLLSTAAAVGVVVFIIQGSQRGDDASLHGADMIAVVRSIGNTTHDPSNVDRLERWHAASNMFLSNPLTGVGPGNFQFALGARWNEGNTVERSVVMPIERMMPAWQLGEHLWVRNNALRSPSATGTAHSEYLLAFSELGLFGGLGFSSIPFLLFLMAWQGTRSTKDPWAAISLFAVVTYLGHGLFNNFLDEARLALPFWVALALLTNHFSSDAS